MPSDKSRSKGRHVNTGFGRHFDLIDFGSAKNLAVIHAGSGFWALAPRAAAAGMAVSGKISRAVESKLDGWLDEMRNFRFGRRPSAVYLNPTERCNFNCRYCYLPKSMRKTGRHMGEKKVMQALKIIRDHFRAAIPDRTYKPEIIFHGSEPMLARDAVFAGIEKFYRDFRFGIQTNASLLDAEAVSFIRKHSVGVGISLDGHSAAVANRARRTWGGQGGFAKALAAIEMLGDYPKFNVIATVTQANVASLTSIVEFFHERGVKLAMLNPVRCTQQGGRDLKPDNAKLAAALTKAMDRSYELFRKTGRKLVVSNFANVLIGIVAPTARKLMCDISPCGAGRCFFAVSANGDVFPCSEFLGMDDYNCGNIFRKPLRDILKSAPLVSIMERKTEDINPCAGCAIQHFCGAPCPAEVLACAGKLLAPSPYCQLYEEHVRYALRVIEAGRVDAYLWDGWRDETRKTFSL
ncbi:MAG: peptide-modifying radical SAM enzyme CbpB [Planctomycetes bacterium]|nr:peptide-modifying radical SAM enzyme CbpB [Planctomycetota bacterium]